MADLLWYAALGFNIGSSLAWWLVMTRLARRNLRRWQRWQRWRQREDEQIMRWSRVERCSACTAWFNEDNARLAAKPWHDEA